VLVRGQGMGATTPIVLGLGAALIAGVIAMGVQHRAAPLFVWFGGRVLGQWVAAGSDGETVSEAELRRIYGHAGRVATGTSLHLIAWCGKGAGNWIAFRLLGTPVDISTALAIEALLHAALAAAFLVPGNAGVQEAGYVGVGALFGATPEIALAVSLLRRARDLAVGVPILLFWQFVELRRLRAARSGYQSAGPQTRM
jgi:uncharacterized membrane protein YbhN (UPF0104 family)